MRRPRAWLQRIRGIFFREQQDAELSAELESHLQMHILDNMQAGMTAGEARREALIKLGGIEQTKESYRDQRGVPLLETVVADLRFGARMLRKNPGFTVVAAITLALGLGANTTIFSFANLIIRRPVALPQLDRLVAVSELIPSTEERGISPANYLDLQGECHSLGTLAAYQFWNAAISSDGNSESVKGVRVTANFFSAVGIKPALGRTFLPEDAQPGRENVLLISDAFWKRQFGGGSDVLGKTIFLNHQSFVVIGVMPAKSTFPLGSPLFWAPLVFSSRERSERTELSLNSVGRLAAGTNLEQARAEIETRWMRMEKEYPQSNKDRSMRVVQLLDDLVLDYNRQFALLLLGVVAFVLLIACANVANLQFARAAARQREIAIRASLGAGRRRLLAQLLTESILLSVIGGVVGLVLAFWGVYVLRVTLPSEVQNFCDLNDLRIDSIALMFTVVVTFLAGLLAGIVPAWQQTRGNLHDVLKESGGRATRQGQRLRGLLVIGELALALVLLIGAGLMVKGFAVLLNANPSLAPDSLLTMHIELPPGRYADSHTAMAFSDELLSRLQSLPEAQSAAMASGLPYSFYDDSVAILIEGHTEARSGPTVMPESVSRAYFRSLHLPLREGREFENSDSAISAPVAIVSESMARRFWPGESAVGKRLSLGDPSAGRPALTVVGVVGDVLHEVYDHSFRSIVYQPYQQAPPRAMDFVLRTKSADSRPLATLRAEVQELDPTLTVEHLESMTQKIGEQTSGLRYVAQLMAIFGAIALILSAVGVYGVIAYSVNERRREIGIRMALGAQSRDVLKLVMRSGIRLTISGIVIGVMLALALARLLAAQIYGVSSWDVGAFVGVPAFLSAIALIANYVPSWQATRVDPMIALRYE